MVLQRETMALCRPMAFPAAPAGRVPDSRPSAEQPLPEAAPAGAGAPAEVGGPTGPDPTRYGDWEKSGRCIDF